MTEISVNNFEKEVTCIYKHERYSVRNNGAVLRHPRTGKRPRPTDNKWTFGKPNNKNGYMFISSHRVHQIVARAFHGKPPTSEHIVDHMDTNRQNNRPENLQWLTKLENALLNPITRNRIEYICGSIEKFLEDPSILHGHNLPSNIQWMRTVTPEEAENCKARFSVMGKPKKKYSKTNHMVKRNNDFANRIYKPFQRWEVIGRDPHYGMTETLWCIQCMGGGTYHFPCCPRVVEPPTLEDYFNNINTGDIFICNDDSELIVHKSRIEKDKDFFIVLCKNKDEKWIVISAEPFSKNHFCHYVIGICSEQNEAHELFLSNDKKDFFSFAYNNSQNRI